MAVPDFTLPTTGIDPLVTTKEAIEAKLVLAGIPVLESVAGTGAAYTATGPTGVPADGQWMLFTPHLTNTVGAPTLSINSGIAYGFGGETAGTALGIGRLVAGVPVVVRRDGSTLRPASLNDGVPLVSTGGTGAAYTGTLTTHSLLGNKRLFTLVPHITNEVGATLALNGGAAMNIHNMDAGGLEAGHFMPGWGYLCIYTGTTVRIVGAYRVHRDPIKEPHRTSYGTALSLQAEPLVQAGSETQAVTLTDSLEAIWTASRGEEKRGLFCTGTRWIDLTHIMPSAGMSYNIYVASGTTKVFDGTTTWTLPTGLTRIYKLTTGVFSFDPVSGAVTSDTFAADPAPAANFTLATAGQSLAVGFASLGGMYGLQMGLRQYASASVRNCWLVNGATGGTALLKEVAQHSNPSATNWWWDRVGGLPGPAMDTFLAAIAARPAAQPAVSAIYWNLGQSELGHMGGFADVSVAELVTAMKAAFAHVRAEIGDATLPIFLSILGSEDNYAANTLNQAAAVRWAQLQVIADETHTHLGPAYHDIKRPVGDVHLGREGQMLVGWRLAALLANVLWGTTNAAGPFVDQIEELESGLRYRLRVQPHSASNAFGLWEDWSNLVVLPSGTDPLTGTPLAVRRTYWETSGGLNHYNIVLREASAGATVMFPYGWGYELRAGRFPRNVHGDPITVGYGNHWPVQPFASGAF